MYRQAIALSIHLQRPGHEVRMSFPEATTGELESFRPHLLVRHDTDGLSSQDLRSVRFWVEIRYSDGMDAYLSADHHISEIEDVTLEDLLRMVDWAAEASAEDDPPPTSSD
jgi:hypothetical protein